MDGFIDGEFRKATDPLLSEASLRVWIILTVYFGHTLMRNSFFAQIKDYKP